LIFSFFIPLSTLNWPYRRLASVDLFPLADPQKKHVDQEEVRNDAGHKLPTSVLALCEKKGLRQKELHIIAKTGFQMKIPDSAVKSYNSFFVTPQFTTPTEGPRS